LNSLEVCSGLASEMTWNFAQGRSTTIAQGWLRHWSVDLDISVDKVQSTCQSDLCHPFVTFFLLPPHDMICKAKSY
jgi:hypothetical protein